MGIVIDEVAGEIDSEGRSRGEESPREGIKRGPEQEQRIILRMLERQQWLKERLAAD